MKLLISAIVLVLILVAIGVEVALRWRFGFGNPLLYLPDAEMGYRLAPNQSVKRFGNRIQINRYSMRSPEITPDRPAHTLRILLIGDSVVNGNWWTDQSQTVSEMLRQRLEGAIVNRAENHGDPIRAIEVLNASANSWAPRNELAYLQRFGTFQSQVVVLVINTDDLFATTPTPLAVGHDPNYPDRKPWFAIEEVMTRYLLPAPAPSPALKAITSEGGDRVGRNLEAIQQIHQLAQRNPARFLVIMTPLLREVKNGPRPYEIDARQRLQQVIQQQSIEFIDALPSFQIHPQSDRFYRDHIHLSPIGNQWLSDQVAQWLHKTLD